MVVPSNILFDTILEKGQKANKSERWSRDSRPRIKVPKPLRPLMKADEIVPQDYPKYWYAGRYSAKESPSSGGVLSVGKLNRRNWPGYEQWEVAEGSVDNIDIDTDHI